MKDNKKAPSTVTVSEATSQQEYITTKDKRARNFAAIVYPDSAPDNWLDIIAESKTPIFVSPLHEFDKNPTGEPKKPHFHVLVAYEGKKSMTQAREFIQSFGGVGLEVVQSLRGYSRYLCHLDNPEKYQYQTDKVLCFGGADYITTIGLPTDKYKAIREMMEWCDDNNCVSFAELITYAREDRFDWFRVLCDNGTVVMKEYLKSKVWTGQVRKFPKTIVYVSENGEVLGEELDNGR